MFGYVFPDKPEMKIKEFELFRAYYCGLCKSIGRNCGQVSRFTLNYDCSFLSIVLSSLKGDPESIKPEKCIAHPLNKRLMVGESNVLEYVSYINIMLSYYKLLDDYNDEGSIKHKGLMIPLKPAFKKALKQYPKKGDVITKRLDELSAIEKSGCKSIDEAADPFAKLTGDMFMYEPLCTDENTKKALSWFGYNIGKWIYIIDAYDDIEKDIKNKSFNPILLSFCYNNEKAIDFKNKVKDNIKFTLTYTLSEVGKAFELLEIKKNREIIENIVYGGMYKKTLQIINKGEKDK
jgi:hypothetical protein